MLKSAVLVLACLPLHALADAEAGEKKAQLCLLCHKPVNTMSAVPLLEGQPASYLVAAITAYKAGERKDPGMNANVASLSKKDIRDIADYFASRPFPPRSQNLDREKVGAGQKLVSGMNCGSCHEAAFRGAAPRTPRLAGQTYHYLAAQLEAFREGRRNHPPGMPVLHGPEIEALASYLASLQ